MVEAWQLPRQASLFLILLFLLSFSKQGSAREIPIPFMTVSRVAKRKTLNGSLCIIVRQAVASLSIVH